MVNKPKTLPNTRPNMFIEECHSTNDIVRAFAEKGYPHGTWIAAKKQIRGRGRFGKPWISNEGNLFLSLLLRPKSSMDMTWIPLTCAIGVCEAIIEKNPRWNVKVKWPNDLFLRGAKLGGILCEGVSHGSDYFVVAGIGVNCLNSPQGIDQKTICLKTDPSTLTEGVIRAVLENFKILERGGEKGGSKKISKTYLKYSFLKKGKEIYWNSQKGKVMGLGSMGELLVQAKDGKMISLYAEEIKVAL